MLWVNFWTTTIDMRSRRWNNLSVFECVNCIIQLVPVKMGLVLQLLLIFEVVFFAGSPQTGSLGVFYWENEVLGWTLGSASCQREISLSFRPHVQNTELAEWKIRPKYPGIQQVLSFISIQCNCYHLRLFAKKIHYKKFPLQWQHHLTSCFQTEINII